MQASFNPYREWLDVADGQPPGNFYALFGLEPFENDATAIAVAVDRLRTRVRGIRPGAHMAEWQSLLDQISAGKSCLLDPAAKAAYDVQLRQSLPQSRPRSVAPSVAPPEFSHSPAVAVPPGFAKPAMMAVPPGAGRMPPTAAPPGVAPSPAIASPPSVDTPPAHATPPGVAQSPTVAMPPGFGQPPTISSPPPDVSRAANLALPPGVAGPSGIANPSPGAAQPHGYGDGNIPIPEPPGMQHFSPPSTDIAAGGPFIPSYPGQMASGPSSAQPGYPPTPPATPQEWPAGYGYPPPQGAPSAQGYAPGQGYPQGPGYSPAQGYPPPQGYPSPQGYPQQGYPPGQGYPAPQGYPSAQGAAPAPGYPVAPGYGQPQGYPPAPGYTPPQGYPPGQPAPQGYPGGYGNVPGQPYLGAGPYPGQGYPAPGYAPVPGYPAGQAWPSPAATPNVSPETAAPDYAMVGEGPALEGPAEGAILAGIRPASLSTIPGQRRKKSAVGAWLPLLALVSIAAIAAYVVIANQKAQQKARDEERENSSLVENRPIVPGPSPKHVPKPATPKPVAPSTPVKPAVGPGPVANANPPAKSPAIAIPGAPEKVRAQLPPPVAQKLEETTEPGSTPSPSVNVDPAKQEELKRALAAARKALVARDLKTARKQVEKAEAAAQTPEEQAEAAGCHTLLNDLTEFWRLMRLRISKIMPLEEFEFGKSRAIVAEVDGASLTIRSEGRNYQYRTPEELPAALLRELVNSGFGGDAATLVIAGAFLAVDPEGNRDAANRYFMKASGQGVEIKDLLDEIRRVQTGDGAAANQ